MNRSPLIAQNEVLLAQAENNVLLANFRPVANETVDENQDMIAKAAKEAASPNQRRAADAVLRTARLHAVGNWVQAQVDEVLDLLEGELVGLLRTADPSGYGGEAKLAALFAAAEDRVWGRYAAIQAKVEGYFAKLDGHLKGRQHGSAAGRTVLGLTMAEHFGKQAEDATLRFKAAVRAGVANGEELSNLVARVEGGDKPLLGANAEVVATAGKKLLVQPRLADAASTSINKVIQAAITELASGADLEAGKGGTPTASAQATSGWQWIAVMDANTCPQCEFYDGMQWDSEFNPVGDAAEYPGDPGLHFGCRCSRIPVDLGEPPAPELSFDDYLAQFSRNEQVEAFGEEALRAYQRGTISAAQLAGQKESMMTLEQFLTL